MKDKIYQLFIKNHISIDHDVFTYGLNVFKHYFVFLIFLIPLGIYFKILIKIILFLILYIPLRRFIGGFHFNNDYLCTFFSVICSFLIPYFSDQLIISNNFFIILSYTIMLLVTIKIGTVDHYNKKLSSKEKMIFKRKAILIEIIYCVLNEICLLLNIYYLANLILFTTTFSVFGILVAFLNNKLSN